MNQLKEIKEVISILQDKMDLDGETIPLIRMGPVKAPLLSSSIDNN